MMWRKQLEYLATKRHLGANREYVSRLPNLLNLSLSQRSPSSQYTKNTYMKSNMCKYVAKSASFNIVHCLFFRPPCDFTRAVWWPARWMVGLRNDIWYIMTIYNISDDLHVEWWDWEIYILKHSSHWHAHLSTSYDRDVFLFSVYTKRAKYFQPTRAAGA